MNIHEHITLLLLRVVGLRNHNTSLKETPSNPQCRGDKFNLNLVGQTPANDYNFQMLFLMTFSGFPNY